MPARPLEPPPALEPERPPRAARAMIVDDDGISSAFLGAALEQAGFEVRVAASGEACLEAIGGDTALVDVVLSDIRMPEGMDGFELLERLRALEEALSVVLMTGHDGYAMVRRAMSVGAYDYLGKPIGRVEEAIDAARRAAGATRLVRERAELLEEARERNAQLHALNRELEILASTDALTGVCNRRHVDLTLERQMGARDGSPFAVSLLLLDIDHFKRINDEHGHETGDEVLRMVALTLLSTLRPQDLVGRYGGEEFLIVLTGVGPRAAVAVAERVLDALGAIDIEHGGTRLSIGASIGIAGIDADAPTVGARDLVKRADVAMYRAKDGGRNRVVLGAPAPCPPPR